MSRKIIAPKREVVPMRFPLLSKKGLEKFLREVSRIAPALTNPLYEINLPPRIALHVEWDSPSCDGIRLSRGINKVLAKTMNIIASTDYDKRYGRHSRYYLYTSHNQTFVLIGDNCYGEAYARLLLNWAERLPKEDKKVFLLPD